MKLAFILLAVVNVAFFLWAQTLPEPERATQTFEAHDRDGDKSIQLLHEMNPSSKTMGDIMESGSARKPKIKKEPARVPKDPERAAAMVGAPPPVDPLPVSPPLTDIERQVADVEARHTQRIEATLAARAADERKQRGVERDEPPPRESRVAMAEIPRTCYTLGPFGLKADALDISGKLIGLGQTATTREEQVKGGLRYLVIDATRDKRAAEKRLKELTDKKVEGAEIILEGDYENMVMLGSYDNESEAQARLNAIVKLGFRPVMEKHTESRPVYWVDVEDGSRPLSPSQLREVISGFEGIDKRERLCR